MVEFALVVTIFLMLFMGLVEFGRIFNAILTLDNAARQGARVAAVGKTDAEIRTAVKAVATNLDIEDSMISITPAVRPRFTAVTVRINSSVRLIAPIISGVLTNPFPVQGEATMMMEQ
jgi:Flp pilus assembly protein TadG